MEKIMGYTYRNNGKIKDFWPDDDENTVYISHNPTLDEIIELVRERWQEPDFENIEISAENIHTSCLTYDLHDSSDYTEFVVIRRTKNATIYGR